MTTTTDQHQHHYRADIADWWCETEQTVTDHCSDESPICCHDATRRGSECIVHPDDETDKPSKPCLECAAIGRFTWLDADGSCRRKDAHR